MIAVLIIGCFAVIVVFVAGSMWHDASRDVDNARYVLTLKGDDVLDQATRDRIWARIEREES